MKRGVDQTIARQVAQQLMAKDALTAHARDFGNYDRTGANKAAISKACSEQADAKGLHGKQRKKVRSECKRKGGEG